MSYTRQLVRATLSLIVLSGMVCGIPLSLYMAFGTPIPQSLPSLDAITSALTNPASDDAIVNVFGTVAWIVWVIFLAVLIEESVAALRGTERRYVSFGPMQIMAASLISAIVLAMPSSIKLGTPEMQFSLAVAAESAATPVVSPEPMMTNAMPVVEQSTRPTQDYTVQRRDNLWRIADKHLGAGTRWKEIWDLNKGSKQVDGRTFTDQNFVRPGWVLQLPIDATATPVAVVVPSAPAETVEPTSEPTVDLSVVDGSQDATTSVDEIAESATDAVVEPEVVAPDSEATDNESSALVMLPSGSIVGVGLASAVAAAAIAIRRRRRVTTPVSEPAPGIAWTDPTIRQAVVDLEHFVRRQESGCEPLEQGIVQVGITYDVPDVIDLAQIGSHTYGNTAELRSVLVSLVATDKEAQVIVATSALADDVLPNGDALASVIVAASISEAVDLTETLMTTRSRLFAELDVDNIDSFREAAPGEPMPTIVLVVPNGTAESGRIAALTTKASAYGLAVLGVTTADVADDNATTSGAAFTLTKQDASAVVDVLAAADGGYEAAPLEQQEFDAPEPTTASIVLRLFGTPRFEVSGKRVNGLRAKSIELAAVLAMNPQGMTWESAAAVLWPEATKTAASGSFRTTVSNLRTVLRKAAEVEDKILDLRDGLYFLDSSVVDCDYRKMQAALKHSVSANDKTADLQAVMDVYADDLGGISPYEWIEAPREDARLRARDAGIALARLHESNGDVEAALQTLDRVVEIEPLGEDAYKRAITLRIAQGDQDGALGLYRLLQKRLSELDMPVAEEIASLFTRRST